jgi:hypothetical protein
VYTYSSSSIRDANRATATTTDQAITPIESFTHISIYNEGTTELRVSVNKSSATGGKIIFVPAGQAFEDNILGESLHYSTASGTTSFLYVLR